jgi:hypothetical protein
MDSLIDSLLILDLGDDHDALAGLAEHLANVAHAVRVADERREDHVDALRIMGTIRVKTVLNIKLKADYSL